MNKPQPLTFRAFRIAILALLCFVPLPVIAQVGQATLSGTVQDASGAMIAGAGCEIGRAIGVRPDEPDIGGS